MRTLSRHFSQRVELSIRLIKPTLVLEEEDKDTIKFVAKQRYTLSHLFDKFLNQLVTNVFNDEHRGDNKEQNQKLEQQKLKGLKVLRDIVTVLFNDPAKTSGVLGLTNLIWTNLWNESTLDTKASKSQSIEGLSSEEVIEDRVFVLRAFGKHPLIRGVQMQLPRREKLIEMNQQVRLIIVSLHEN